MFVFNYFVIKLFIILFFLNKRNYKNLHNFFLNIFIKIKTILDNSKLSKKLKLI